MHINQSILKWAMGVLLQKALWQLNTFPNFVKIRKFYSYSLQTENLLTLPNHCYCSILNQLCDPHILLYKEYFTIQLIFTIVTFFFHPKVPIFCKILIWLGWIKAGRMITERLANTMTNKSNNDSNSQLPYHFIFMINVIFSIAYHVGPIYIFPLNSYQLMFHFDF